MRFPSFHLTLLSLIPGTGLTLPDGALASTSTSTKLRLDGDLHWHSTTRTFSGSVIYELPATQSEATLLLFPNLFVGTDDITDRELRETAATGLFGGGPDTTRRLGVLQVRDGSFLQNVEAQPWFPCGSLAREPAIGENAADADLTRPGVKGASGLPAALRYEAREREVSVSLPRGGGDACVRLRVKVTFLVPLSLGNYGGTGDGDLRFSGPVIPLVRGLPHEARLRFHGTRTPPVCSGCDAEEQRFSGLPPPVHFLPDSARILKRPLSSGLFVTVLHSQEDAIDDAALATVTAVAEGNPGVLHAQGKDGAHLFLTRDALTRNLVQRQRSEVQLGRGYLKVLPQLEKFHAAALERAVLESLVFDALGASLPQSSFEDWRELDSLARLMSHWRLEKRWSDFQRLESFSRRLSFLPFFQGILSGQSLSNNQVFLGREEAPSLLDTAPMATLLPGLDGRSLSERLDWCLSKEKVAELKTRSMEFFDGTAKATALRTAFLEARSERCEGVWPEVLRRPVRPERIGVYRVPAGIQFRRSSLADAIPGGSGLLRPLLVTDVLRLEAASAGEARLPPGTLWRKPDDALPVSVAESQRSGLSARIEGPSTAWDGALLVLPRPVRFSLTSASARYESNGGGLEFQQGSQWSFEGDPLSRGISFLAQRKQRKYLADLSFFYSADRLLWPCSDPNAPDAVPCAPPFFLPASMGLRSVLSRPRDLRAFFDLGLVSLSSQRSVLASTGGQMGLSVSQPLYRDAGSTAGTLVRINGVIFVPAARLVTVTLAANAGYSAALTSLRDLTGAPESPTSATQVRWFGSQSTEIAWAVAADLKWSLGMGLLFENAVLYAAHQVATEVTRFDFVRKKVPMSQWLSSGLRIYGSLFGAKNQSISVEVIRSLDDAPYSRIALTVGRPR